MSMNTAQISPEPPKHALKHPRRKLSDTVQTPPPKRRKLSEFEARWSEEDGDDDINHVVHRIDPSEDEQKATSASPQSIKHSSNHKQKRSVTYVTMSPQVEVTFEGYANKKHCVCECGHQLNYCISVIEELKGFDGGLDKHIHSLKHRDKLNPHTAPVSAAPANTQAITSFFKPRSKSNTPSNTNTTAPQATSANKNSNRRKKTSNTLPSVENVGASKKQNTIKHKLVFIESGPHPSIVEIQDGDPARIEYCAGFIPQFIQDKTTKAKATVPAKKKSIKETYNLPFECVNKHKKASGIFCVFCGTTVALSDMIRHQSLHFVKEDDNDDDTTDETTTTTPTFTFAVPQPTLQYYIDDGCLKVRSLAEPIELRGDECGICYSKCCRRIVVRTSKASRSKAETLKAFSECPLNFNYNYRSASVSSISNPVVNVPVNCPQENCDFMPYKYLLNEHMKRCHQTTAEMSLTTEQLQQHNDRLKADMKREFKGEVLCDKPPSSNKNTNDKGKRATKERAAAKYSCE
eukprot:813386_1